MADVLSAYLDEQAALPFVWGRSDCGHFVAGWVARLRGEATPPRFGDYATEQGCARFVRRAGGMQMLAAQAFRKLGLAQLPVVVEVQDGDVGLVDVDGHAAFAIRAGGGWTFKSPCGLTHARDGKLLALGRVPCRP